MNGGGRRGKGEKEEEGKEEVLQGVGGEPLGFDSVPRAGLGGEGGEGAGEVLESFENSKRGVSCGIRANGWGGVV